MALNPSIPPPVTEIMNAAHHEIVYQARTGNFNPSEGVVDLVNAPIIGQLYPIFYTLFFLMILIERSLA